MQLLREEESWLSHNLIDDLSYDSKDGPSALEDCYLEVAILE
jgi:hypothetical protein